jgi:hypothetical protein
VFTAEAVVLDSAAAIKARDVKRLLHFIAVTSQNTLGVMS